MEALSQTTPPARPPAPAAPWEPPADPQTPTAGAPGGRLIGLDLARALAVIGMVAAHVAAVPVEVVLGDPGTWTGVVHGHSSVLFALLAGVSLALMSGRGVRPELPEERQRIRLALVGRAAAIFVIGVGLELLNTSVAVILTFYAVLYFLALPFLWARTRTLWGAGLVLGLVGPVLTGLLSLYSTEATLVFGGTYGVPTFGGMMLVGLALGRLRLERAAVALRMMVAGLLVCVAGSAVGAWSEEHLFEDWVSEDSLYSSSWSVSEDELWGDSSAVLKSVKDPEELKAWAEMHGLDGSSWMDDGDSPWTEDGIENGWPDYVESFEVTNVGDVMSLAVFYPGAHSGSSVEYAASGGLAVAVLGLCLLIGPPLRRILTPLTMVGAMPLTAYSVHVLVLFIAVGPYGYVTDNAFFWWLTLGLVLGCWAWHVLLGRGPLERFPRAVSRAITR